MKPPSKNMAKSLASQRQNYDNSAVEVSRQRPAGSISMPPGEGSTSSPPGAHKPIFGRSQTAVHDADAVGRLVGGKPSGG
jgi:hypothetical protein